MLSPDYYANHNDLAEISESEDHFITYCVSLTLIVLFMLPFLLHFKKCINILRTVSRVFEHFYHIGTYTAHIFHLFLAFYHILKELRQLHFHDKNIQQPAVEQILKEVLPPSDEFIKQVTEQLTISLPTYEAHLHQEIPQQQEQEYCESYVFEIEPSTSYQPDILITHPSTPPVVNSNHALSEYIECEERCSKFINQDLNFVQPSNIPSVSKNMPHDDNSSVQVSQSQTQVVSSIVKLPTCTSKDQNSTPPTQIVQPVLEFMPAEIQRAEAEPKFTVAQLLRSELCKEYVQTPIQTLDGIHVHQPHQFLPLAKEAKKLAEALKKNKMPHNGQVYLMKTYSKNHLLSN